MPAHFESDMNTLPTEWQAEGVTHEQPRQSDSIVVEVLHDDARLPMRATQGSAGYDVCAYLNGRNVDCSDGTRQWSVATIQASGEWRLELPAGVMALVPLGFKARLPAGFEAQVRPRSGAAFKKGLAIPNAPGTVDADFPDEWRVIVRNTTSAPLVIAHGERIAQVVLHRYEVLPFVRGTVGRTTERAGGFGSTGQ